MNWEITSSSLVILLGAAMMLCSIVKSRVLFKAEPLIPQRSRGVITRFLRLNTLLMVFFFVAYIVVVAAFFLEILYITDLLISAIFFFGAVFVFLGVLLQSTMIAEIQTTIHGLLPICTYCKKIRLPETDPDDPDSWVPVEEYIAQRTAADFTHGVCPVCTAKQYPGMK